MTIRLVNSAQKTGKITDCFWFIKNQEENGEKR